jgi:hypothetical protein
VPTEKGHFTIRASSSRIEKGLLAIPQRFNDWFPRGKGPIQIVFDDNEKPKSLTFHPYDPVVKESRILGLGHWFSKRGVREGDLISITLEDVDRGFYRIALDRYVRERREQKARQKLQAARTDSEADQELNVLSHLARRRPRELAHEELWRIAQESAPRPRPSVLPGATEQEALNESCPDPSKRVKTPYLLPPIPSEVFVEAVVHKSSGEPGNPRHPSVNAIDLIAGKGRVSEAIA